MFRYLYSRRWWSTLSPTLMVSVFLLVLSLQREKKNKHAYCNEHFYFSSFFTVFVSYWVLKLQVLSSLALIFLCLCASFFFFFTWMFLLDYFFFVCTYLYKIYIDALKSIKCLKCIIHTKTKKSAAHKFPTNVFVCFCFLQFSRFSDILPFLFVCRGEFMSSVKRHRIIFST